MKYMLVSFILSFCISYRALFYSSNFQANVTLNKSFIFQHTLEIIYRIKEGKILEMAGEREENISRPLSDDMSIRKYLKKKKCLSQGFKQDSKICQFTWSIKKTYPHASNTRNPMHFEMTKFFTECFSPLVFYQIFFYPVHKHHVGSLLLSYPKNRHHHTKLNKGLLFLILFPIF